MTTLPPARNVMAGRVLMVLSAFRSADSDLGVTDVHLLTGLDKSVVHRILVTLVEYGYLLQDEVTRRYRIGLAVWELGQRCDVTKELRFIVEPALKKIVAQYDVSGYAGCLSDLDMVYVVSVPSQSIVRVHFDVGRRIPARKTAFGKALLAHIPESELRRLVEGATDRRERRTLESSEFRRELSEIRERGYAVNIHERDPGVKSIGVPLITTGGSVFGAASVSYLASRETGAFADDLIHELLSISKRDRDRD